MFGRWQNLITGIIAVATFFYVDTMEWLYLGPE